MNFLQSAAVIVCVFGLIAESFWTLLLSLILFEIGSGGRGIIAMFLTRK